MLNYLTRLRQREEGFTLIELMIVMVVLGILSGIVLFGVAGFQTDATARADTANQRQCATAVAAWAAVHPGVDVVRNPPPAADLATYFDSSNGGTPPGCP